MAFSWGIFPLIFILFGNYHQPFVYKHIMERKRL